MADVNATVVLTGTLKGFAEDSYKDQAGVKHTRECLVFPTENIRRMEIIIIHEDVLEEAHTQCDSLVGEVVSIECGTAYGRLWFRSVVA